MRKGHEVDIAEVRRFVREQYGFEAVPSLMCGEKDLNFRLQSDAGEYVLKLAAPSVRRAELDFQIHAMERAAQHSLPVAIPHVIRAPSGDALVSFRPDGETRWAHLLSFIPGTVWAHCNPHTDSMLRELGSAVASLDLALAGFVHPEANRPLKWNLSKAAWIRKYLHLIEDGSRRQLVNRQLDEYETRVLPKLADFPRQVIYNDANDHNIVCSDNDLADRKVAGLIDFGDAVESPLVCDAAIACAYAMMAKPDPLGAACEVAAGFHAVSALTDAELELLFQLILTRLCVTVTNAAWQRESEPENGYLQVSASPAWELLETLSRIHPHLAHYRLRAACGFPAVPHASRVEAWLRLQAGEIGPVLEPDLRRCRKIFADWGVASPELANPSAYDDPAGLTARLHARIAGAGAEVAIGGYNCARLSYGTEQFRVAENNRHESRTVHLGLDVFLDAGSPVRAPFDGEVHSFANNAARFDYGPCIILKHAVEDASGDLVFHTLYGHLSPDSLNGLSPGQAVKKGDIIGRLGGTDVNGGWPPHLHLQIITDMLGMQGDFPGACSPSQRPVWLSLSPDPNLIAGIPADFFPDQTMEATEILRLRRERIGYNLSLSYRKKLHIVRGYKQWLYDADGRRYLDCVNNVPHVGHAHPRVVEAGQRQAGILNTNTRYLHELLVRYAGNLAAKFPAPLRVCFLVNSGSEANELALRLVRAHTRQKDMIVVEVGYHGNTTGTIDISPYKFDHKGGMGAPDWVHKVPMPDTFRGPYKAKDASAGKRYAQAIAGAVDRIAVLPPLYQSPGASVRWKSPRGVAAFICEGIVSCGGQIVLPPGYLQDAYQVVRAAGGLCISDEVQTGFGRVGSHFSAFETQNVIPDIVTLGKPIGNGHPLGAVITTPEIAASFNNGLEYFNTFGGNPVSCAIGQAVLDVMDEERLQQRALEVGNYLMEGFRGLMREHPIIGDVRGLGLFSGFEMVRDRETLEPATEEASYLVNRMRDLGFLLSTDGPLENVTKVKPPLCFDKDHADRTVEALDKVLKEDFLRR